MGGPSDPGGPHRPQELSARMSETGSITRDEVAHLARLARLALDDDELDRFAGQLDVIVTAVARGRRWSPPDVPPTSHALPLTNVIRPDEVRPGADPASRRCPARPPPRTAAFRVPRILEEDVTAA